MSAPHFAPSFFVMLVNNQTKQPFCTIKKPGKYTVGREGSKKVSDVQLKVNDAYLSGQHFIIFLTPKNEAILRDNNSVNGTSLLNIQTNQFIELKTSEDILLTNGDVFKAGNTEFLVKLPAKIKSQSQLETDRKSVV